MVGISLVIAFLYSHPGEMVPEGIDLQLEIGAVQVHMFTLESHYTMALLR